MSIYRQSAHAFVLSVLLLMLASCGSGTVSKGGLATAPSVPDMTSSVRFTLAEAATIMTSQQPTSKLRHGHKEFTIEVGNAEQRIFMAFYGYEGPGTYTLSRGSNGGDIHIYLANGQSWDLAVQPSATCQLEVSSQGPGAYPGVDRMRGTFSCLHLFTSEHHQTPGETTLSNGRFDIAILVES